MASSTHFSCSSCSASVEAWSDGDPYVITPAGRKRHVHHPTPGWEDAVGVDVPHLCLGCGARFTVDSRKPRTACPTCRSERIVATTDLAHQPCPCCADGAFDGGTRGAIS